MRTIVAPTDFSDVSLNAVNYAADLASAFSARLSLLHVFQLPIVYSEIPVAADNVESVLKDEEQRIELLKQELVKRTKGQIEIITEVTIGSVVSEIKDFCEMSNAYCVVMSANGAGSMERLFFGSNTIGAVKSLDWPLVVVPPGATFRAIKRIGLACDLKRVADTVPINEVKGLVKQFGAELHVLHVNRDDDTSITSSESIVLQKALHGLRPVYHFLENEDVSEGLNNFAETNSLDLLIVAPKRHGIVDHLFHRSESKHLMLNSHIPVMSVHE